MDDSLRKQFVELNLVGKSEVFLRALATIEKVSNCHMPVLIQGETGTGKENAARAIHYLGDRAHAPFVPLNCGALTGSLLESELFGYKKGAFTDAKSDRPGLVELADGGTLFLDEIDSLPHKAQTALLRFLQNQEFRAVGGSELRKVNVRIVSASNAHFEKLINKKLFREDLFYRLNVLNVYMPPLRERANDIALIATCLLNKFSLEYACPRKYLSSSAMDWLEQQTWKGNVRELENTLLRQVVIEEESETLNFGKSKNAGANNTEGLRPDTFEPSFQQAKANTIKEFEKSYLRRLLQKTAGNISEAARISGKERRAVGKMLKKYNIDREAYVDTLSH